MIEVKPVFLLLFICMPSDSRSCVEYYQTSTRHRTTTRCGLFLWGRCPYTKTLYESRSRCCSGWRGSGCRYAICNGRSDLNSCSLNEGRVQLSNGRVYTKSGGTCVRPNQCSNCNPGYYPSGSYCRACTAISNCLYPSCRRASDSTCRYCAGEVKSRYGWYAYTRFYSGDSYKRCRQACSWRPGSRCYPGICSDTTTSSCRCTSGFSGTDCKIITENPAIVQTFLLLTEITATSKHRLMAPHNSTGGSPQAIVWTNNVRLGEFSAHFDASFNKSLPSTPGDFYINFAQTKIGIINGGIQLEWKRGSSLVAGILNKQCRTQPAPMNYRCHFDGFFSTNNWTLPFEHNDRLRFTVFASNGGYVSVFNRENGSTELYNLVGRTKSDTFEVGFDTDSPKHCIIVNHRCPLQVFYVPDTSTAANIHLKWSGWSDSLSGMNSYHFEVFRLQPAGTNDNSDLIHEDQVNNFGATHVPANKRQTSVTLPATGPYSILLKAYDHAGNYETARRLVVFDNRSIVSLQGTKNFRADNNGKCTLTLAPSAPIVTNAAASTGCLWINNYTSVIDVAWYRRFLNSKHHSGKWLNPVRSIDGVLRALDDNYGQRTTQNVDNVLGIVAFYVSYRIIHRDRIITYPLAKSDDVQAENFSFPMHPNDGMKLEINVRAIDIVGSFADDFTEVKVDMSPPIIEDLWLTVGNRLNISVHNVEDLTKLQIEWKAYDIHSGIEKIYWRIFDNFTGSDLDHGFSYMSPQGNAETMENCTTLYGNNARGADCYCTPFDGCFHQHFQVRPSIQNNDSNGMFETMYLGVHDRDYFIEVTATNKAMLKTTATKKISIDTSPPAAGSVYEGVKGEPELDAQQDKKVMIHWNDFFDKESGIMFYKYGYGRDCLNSKDFDLDSDKKLSFLEETYLTEATFEVQEEGMYYVTVAAYNHALDHSLPVCSDGVVIDTSMPKVIEFQVDGAKVDPTLLRDPEDNLWFLNDDRTIQKVQNASDSCRLSSRTINHDILEEIPRRRYTNGEIEYINILPSCKNYSDSTDTIVSVLPRQNYINLSWNVTGSISGVYDFEIGVSSTLSRVDFMVDFMSSNHHTRLTISNPYIPEGQFFYFIVKSLSRSGVTNQQMIGPFLLISNAPTFEGDVLVEYQSEYYQEYLTASWDESSFQDIYKWLRLDYQFAVGTKEDGTNILPFSDLQFFGKCKRTQPPTCTAILLKDLNWNLHQGKTYYVTIRVNNTAGLVTRVSSKPYKHETLPPSAGVVIDLDPGSQVTLTKNDDIDYQTSKTMISARWYGLEHFYASVRYTACITDGYNNIINETCEYVGSERAVNLTASNLTTFKKYKVLVKAETDSLLTKAFSDGVIIIDDTANLNVIKVYDGEPCTRDKVILSKNKTHQDQDITQSCFRGKYHQASIHRLSSYWVIPEEWVSFVPGLYWHIEERGSYADAWIAKTEPVHVPVSSASISINFPLTPGHAYRFGLTFCAGGICYNTLNTTGVTVIPNPPKTGNFFVFYLEENRRIEVVFEMFYDEDIEDLREAQRVMDFYEWNIADNDNTGRVVRKWTRVYNLRRVNQTHLMFDIVLDANIRFSKCWNLLLKGTNKAGYSSTVASSIKSCHDMESINSNIVIDIVLPNEAGYFKKNLIDGFGKNGESETWARQDMDYTPYDTVLSAAWPDLRYKTYDWAVVELQNNTSILYDSENMALQNPCNIPGKVFCGKTDKNHISVYFYNEPLLNGHRYAICIHANAANLENGDRIEGLPELKACSDGITIDKTPPVTGGVWIYYKGATYQTFKSETTVYWEKFTDIEEMGRHVHESGISHYKVALGSYPGGYDVVSPIHVGICNHFTFHNLSLQDDHNYYATVTGYDFTGRHSSVISDAIFIDTTMPQVNGKQIPMSGKFIKSLSNVQFCWSDVFNDPNSGMAFYKWGIGSRQGYDDKVALNDTYSSCVSIKDLTHVLEEGFSYFVTVLGYNNAGLFSVATSNAFIVETSPPTKGYVSDGERNSEHPSADLDYQTYTSRLSAHWGGFFDAHTQIIQYIVSVGTYKEARDVIGSTAVGLKHAVTFDDLSLQDGMTYYFTVTACNEALLCRTVTSDGILVDSSAPLQGKVIDGDGNKDIQYQASRNIVGARSFGFTDTQSELSHFTWRVGTIPGSDDIMPSREIHLNEIAVIPNLMKALNKQLPQGKMIFNTIRAYNKGGLYSESSSDGFLVDPTPPIFTIPLKQVSIGSLIRYTTVLRSSLSVQWKVEDQESFISKQYLSVAAHRGDNFIATAKLTGSVDNFTFTQLHLHDGSLYSVKIIACNGANLCSQTVLPDILFDSTPPVEGTFAVNTDSAVSPILDRQPDDWMVWEQSKIHLAWLGFSDIHSEILEYHINIGSFFMADDLNEEADQPYIVFHSPSDEETLQMKTLNTKNLWNYQHVFISMWAVNGVGLKSGTVHSQFRLIPGGSMYLIRRCESYTCLGHCDCAPEDAKCEVDAGKHECVNNTGVLSYAAVDVEDKIYLTGAPPTDFSGEHTPTDMMLSARWYPISGERPLWYEWSAGLTEYETPVGVFENGSTVWYNAGRVSSWTFTLPKGSSLIAGERYSFFVRAWFDENTFSVFKSKGVICQTLPPHSTMLSPVNISIVEFNESGLKKV